METTTEGEVEEYINQRFELTPMSSLLTSEVKNSVRNFALLFGLEPFRKAIDDLLYCIETGENPLDMQMDWTCMNICNKIKKMLKYLMVQ